MPDRPGLTAPEMVDAAGRGELDVLWMSGGNFLDVLPDPPAVGPRWAGCRCGSIRTWWSPADAGRGRRRGAAAGGHPLRAGGRRHRDHHRAADRVQPRAAPAGGRGPQRVAAVRRRGQPGAARAARRSSRGRPTPTCGPRSPGSCRSTRGSRRWPTPATRCSGAAGTCAPAVEFPTPDGRAAFTPLDPPVHDLPEGAFLVSTRRGKQFNSMVQAEVDPLTGAVRDAIMIDPADAASPGPRRRRPRPPALGHRHARGHGHPGAAPVPHPPGPLAGGQRPHPRRRRPPRALLQGARLQRGGHGRARLTSRR